MIEVKELTYPELDADPRYKELCDAYAEEAANEGFGQYRLKQDFYYGLSAEGRLKCLGVYEDGELIGFAGGFRQEQTHFADSPLFLLDGIFVSATASPAGSRLFFAVLSLARRLGCTHVVAGAKKGTRAYEFFSLVGTPANTLFLIKA